MSVGVENSVGFMAEERDSVAIAWPADVPGWDPQRLLLADAQPVYRMVFDPPLERDARLELEPALVRQWEMANNDLLSYKTSINVISLRASFF